MFFSIHNSTRNHHKTLFSCNYFWVHVILVHILTPAKIRCSYRVKNKRKEIVIQITVAANLVFRLTMWDAQDGNRYDGPLNRPSLDGPLNRPSLDVPLNRPSQDVPLNRPSQDGPLNRQSQDGPLNRSSLDGPLNKPSLEGPLNIPSLDGPLNRPSLDGP